MDAVVDPGRIELTPRQKLVLGLVVREYTRTADPVGSKVLVEEFGLDVSPATVRNEMAYLEQLGLLTHPHTSAGRVPTEWGYRYFVENIMPRRGLALADRLRIRHQFHQLGLQLEQWLQLSAAIVAEMVRNAAVVTAPRAAQARFKHLELISTYGNAILLVLVLQDGTVQQQGLVASEALGQEALSNISDELSRRCRGLTAAEIDALAQDDFSFVGEVLRVVAQLMRRGESSATEAYWEGVSYLLAQPEFRDAQRAQKALGLLEGNDLVSALVAGAAASEGITVLIGGQFQDRLDLSSHGLVFSRYGVPPELTGALGVLGPVRMHYEEVIPVVQYVAELLSDLVWHMFGPGEGRAARAEPGWAQAEQSAGGGV